MVLPVVGYVGLTHLGLNSAVAAAEKGCTIVCVDPDEGLVARLKDGELPIKEPQFPELLDSNADRITFTTEPARLSDCDIVYVAPDVATDDDGHSDLSTSDSRLNFAASGIGENTALIILSQVPPGFTRARRKIHKSLFYQVETLIFGRAMERALFPERFIVGVDDSVSDLPPAYREFLNLFGCPVLTMRYESAELAKISINCCLVASISVANTLAELCENIGADWSEIVPALKLDKRIGQHAYLSPGLGISGGNLERDLATVMLLAASHNTDAGIVASWVANSSYRKNWPYRTMQTAILNRLPDASIAVLGLSYKEDTHSIKNSPALALIGQLNNAQVTAYDPVVSVTAVPETTRANSALEAARDADALAIMTPWAEFRELEPEQLLGVMSGRTIIDPYKMLDGEQARRAGFEYYTLGVADRASGS